MRTGVQDFRRDLPLEQATELPATTPSPSPPSATERATSHNRVHLSPPSRDFACPTPQLGTPTRASYVLALVLGQIRGRM